MIQLHLHQTEAILDIRQAYGAGKRAPLFVAPTGSGKTVLFSKICKGANARGNNVLILAHRVELIEQISATLKAFEIEHGIIAAGFQGDPYLSVQVASVQTLRNRMYRTPFAPAMIIIDEAHHCIASNTFGKLLRFWPHAKILGVTATPCRLSGEGLGDVFDCLIEGPNTEHLIAGGYLSPARTFAPPGADTSALRVHHGDFIAHEAAGVMDRPKITGDAVSHYKRHADGLPFVAFCCHIEHAQHVAEQFRAAGVPTVALHSNLDRELRARTVADFRAGRIKGLTSVDVISEGFDVPGIHCGIFLRPTASRGLWIQQFGRILRLAEGKTHAIALDHAGNAHRHGLPTEPQEWSLEGTRARRGPAKQEVRIRICGQCYSAFSLQSRVCPECGHCPPVESRKLSKVEGELIELQARKAKRREDGGARTLEDLIALGRSRGYKKPEWWARMKLQGRRYKEPEGVLV